MKTLENQSLSTIALEHTAAIPVFERYHLDFCCRGKNSLADACTDRKLNLAEVVNEIEKATDAAVPDTAFSEMDATQLIAHLLYHHHNYIRRTVPVILSHLEKLTVKHGDRYPWLYKVYHLFVEAKTDLLQHLQKEESVLFPQILRLSANSSITLPVTDLQNPIEMMETEHDFVGQLFFEIRKLTNNYLPPDDACTTHKVCLNELKEFEADLHQHIHLENNLLFPLVRKWFNH